MKNLFNRTLSILCAVMLLISAASVWAAAEEAATPTNLNPAEQEIVEDSAEEEIIPENPAEDPQPEPVQEPETEPVQEPETEPEQEPEAVPEQEPEAEPEKDPEEDSEKEPAEENIDSVEVVITKALTVGQNWEGKMKKTKPAILKLDISSSGFVYILVEGKDVWATVEKSDRVTENPSRTETDPETGRLVLKLQAEEGSYLITLGPVEPNLLAQAKVTVMGQKAYEAWEDTQNAEAPKEGLVDSQAEDLVANQQEESEEQSIEEVEKEEPESGTNEASNPGWESAEYEIPEETDNIPNIGQVNEEMDLEKLEIDRSVDFDFTWDSGKPMIGDTVHFRAIMVGYDQLDYTLQWQLSPDGKIWTDYPGATTETIDVVITKDIDNYFWRLIVYIEEQQES